MKKNGCYCKLPWVTFHSFLIFPGHYLGLFLFLEIRIFFFISFLFIFVFAWNTFCAWTEIYFWNIQAIRPSEYSNLIQAWNISLNINLHRYKIFQWPQNYLADFETAAIRKWHYYSTRCVSTYFHIPGGICTLSGTLKWNWRAGETHSIFIITSRIWNNSVWSLKNPMLFQAHLSVCHAVVSCHKTVITVSLMWQCWGIGKGSWLSRAQILYGKLGCSSESHMALLRQCGSYRAFHC